MFICYKLPSKLYVSVDISLILLISEKGVLKQNI
jgi:hypothetical protein